MGLINYFKKLFNKNIECGAELDGQLIYLFPSSGRIVHINRNIIIPDGYNAVFVVKDKITDVMYPGKHKMDEQTLPQTFNRLNYIKKIRNGKVIRKFKGDVYFVSMNTFRNFNFSSDIPFIIRSHEFGKVKGKCEGACEFTITDSRYAISYLKQSYAYLKKGVAENDFGKIIGNEINRKLERSKMDLLDILNNVSVANDYLGDELNNCFDDIGFRVKDVKLVAIDFDKRIQKKVGDYLANKNLVEKKFSQMEFQKMSTNEIDNPILKSNNQRNMVAEINPEAQSYFEPKNSSAIQNSNVSGNCRVICKYCGFEFGDNFNFCPNCGKHK